MSREQAILGSYFIDVNFVVAGVYVNYGELTFIVSFDVRLNSMSVNGFATLGEFLFIVSRR